MSRLTSLRPLCAAFTFCLTLAGCAGGMQVRSGAGTMLSANLTPITADLVQRQNSERGARNAQDISALTAPEAPYHIGAGDVLSIIVWGHPELANAVLATQTPLITQAEQTAAGNGAPAGFVVSDAGQIQFPFAGTLTVAGLTEQQARALLARQLARYINAPNITLRVQAFRSRRIYVDGEVKAPSDQPAGAGTARDRSGHHHAAPRRRGAGRLGRGEQGVRVGRSGDAARAGDAQRSPDPQ